MKRINCKFLSDSPIEKKIMEEAFFLEETDNPDFVFCRPGDVSKALQYDCVRVLFNGENIRPDFNLLDYAYGFDQMQFGDRYLYLPLYATGYCKKELEQALRKHLKSEEYYLGKKKFCNIVVSNSKNASDLRYKFFESLSKNYKRVDSAGSAFNNMHDGKPIGDKHKFCENYKFAITFENSSYKGYTTEKIVHAWASGAIPIYWGDPDIGKQFNEKAFINCHNYKEFDEVIEEIKRIDNDDRLYLAIQREPIFLENSSLLEISKDEYFKSWLYHILEQEPKEALRRTNAHDGWGKEYERSTRRHIEMDKSFLVKAAYKISRLSGHRL